MPQIKKICISNMKGPKHQTEDADVIEDFGVDGDYHAKKGSIKQVSFLSEEIIDEVKKEGLVVTPGAFGENFIIKGIDLRTVEIGGHISIGNEIIVEITKIGKECIEPCSIYKTLGRCIMPECGVFAKVIKGGHVHVEDSCDYSK
jgi:molybdopterin adenylyltransferase